MGIVGLKVGKKVDNHRAFSIKPEQAGHVVELFELCEVPEKDFSISVDVKNVEQYAVEADIEDRIWRIIQRISARSNPDIIWETPKA